MTVVVFAKIIDSSICFVISCLPTLYTCRNCYKKNDNYVDDDDSS